LFLAAAEVITAASDGCGVGFLEFFDEFAGLGNVGGFGYAGGCPGAEGDVFSDSTGEEKGFLRDEADVFSEGGEVVVADIDIVD